MQKVRCKICGKDIEIMKLSDKYYVYIYHRNKAGDGNCPNSAKKVK